MQVTDDMEKAIRVLIVDDSAVVRQTLSDMLSHEPGIEIMATAQDPFVAAERIREEVPDVITLDIEMPRTDGIAFLKKIITQHPISVVICSNLAGRGSETAMKALEYGAVEIIAKPRIGTKHFLEESRIRICDAVRAAHLARPRRVNRALREVAPKLTADAVIAKASGAAAIETTDKVIIVGASTGGTEAIRAFLEGLPADAPGTVIVQHMPENFTASFARRLDRLCRVSVKEAANNDTVMRGRVLIAPGNFHTLLKRNGARYYVEVKEGPLVSRHRPSVDVLFRSAARYAGRNAVGVIMTGMGDDGAKGLLEMKEAGAFTVAQDEDTCVVFGMPQEAIRLGAAQRILPLGAIARSVLAKTG